MRVLVAEPLAREGLDLLRADHDVDERSGLSSLELASILPGYEALIVRSQVRVDATLIESGRRLLVIGRAGVGVDNVDVAAATGAGITVVNAPGGNTNAAAELTLGLLLSLARRIPAADASVRRGEWKRAAFAGVELSGRTLGVVGLGRIGREVAARARAFGMRVVASDPYVTPQQAAEAGVELVDLPALLDRADVLTVHVPLSGETRALIGAAELARLRPGAMVLNVARGGVYDEAAVAEALESGRLGGAAFDVYEHEPPADSPLLSAPRVVLTPHLGASTEEAQVRVAIEIAEQVLAVLAGRQARSAVNAPPHPRTAAAPPAA